jgi:DNA-directed RNA polymerase omega subunit
VPKLPRVSHELVTYWSDRGIRGNGLCTAQGFLAQTEFDCGEGFKGNNMEDFQKQNHSTRETTRDNAVVEDVNGEQWPGIDSTFRLIVVAALRSKQLLHGARPRIKAEPLRRRNTSIALEEVRRGLVSFSTKEKKETLTVQAE